MTNYSLQSWNLLWRESGSKLHPEIQMHSEHSVPCKSPGVRWWWGVWGNTTGMRMCLLTEEGVMRTDLLRFPLHIPHTPPPLPSVLSVPRAPVRCFTTVAQCYFSFFLYLSPSLVLTLSEHLIMWAAILCNHGEECHCWMVQHLFDWWMWFAWAMCSDMHSRDSVGNCSRESTRKQSGPLFFFSQEG